jgi:hypothetical protein
MTDFDRTSNSETANILSTSYDKLLLTAPTHSCENLKPRTGLLMLLLVSSQSSHLLSKTSLAPGLSPPMYKLTGSSL